MLDIFRGLKNLIKISHLRTDSPIFRLHYSLTVMVLIAFSLIVTTRQYVGNPIDCVHTKDIPEDVLNTYCWIHSTYTIKSAFRKKVGSEVPYPGVETSKDEKDKKLYKYYQWVCFCLFFQVLKSLSGQKHSWGSRVIRLHSSYTTALILLSTFALFSSHIIGFNIKCDSTYLAQSVIDTYCWVHGTYSVKSAMNRSVYPYPGVVPTKTNEEKRVHSYYQWTSVVLLAQAILFYTPRWLWKSWEGGKIHALMMDLDIGICSEIEKKQKKKLMLDYLWENLRYHNSWAYKYYFCEVLALINVIGQMFLMNRFFDGAFLTFGIEVLQFMDSDQEDRVDPMIKIFPRMTKCTFYKYGASGEVERHDAICILPLNVVNEKIYVFLWFWFIILSVLTFFTVVYRIVIIFSPRMRVYLLRMRFRLIRRDAIEVIVRRSKMGDWFLFYMLGENVDSVIFRDVMHELSQRLGHNSFHNMPSSANKGDIQEA